MRFVSLPRSAGIAPDNLLFASDRCVRLESCPNSEGICPVKPLFVRLSRLSVCKLPNAAGRVALPRSHEAQVKPTTRGAAVAATPAQSASLTLPSARGHTATPDQLCIFVFALQSLKTAVDDVLICSEPLAASSELQSVSSDPVSGEVSTLGVVVAPGVLAWISEAYGIIAGLDSVQTSGTVV